MRELSKWIRGERCAQFVGIGALLSCMIVLFLSIVYTGEFEGSVDSWSLLEISNHLFSDFGKINTLRHYQPEIAADYNASFPFLWPIILAAFNYVFDVGIYAGIILNYLIFTGVVIMNLLLSKRCRRDFKSGRCAFQKWNFLREGKGGYSLHFVGGMR